MKKLMFAAVALTAGFAMAETIESDQIVGYVQAGKAAAAQYVPLATQFEALGGGDIAVKNAVTAEPASSSTDWGSADQLWRWNTATASWTKYALYEVPRSRPAVIEWRKIVGDDVEDAETTDKIPAGETFFFLRAGGTEPATLTLAGGVKDLNGESAFTVSSAQLAFVANPWPTEIVIKDFSQFVTDGELSASTDWGSADQIWLWDTAKATWAKYAYYEIPRSRPAVTQWRKIVDGEVEEDETTETIPAGKGIFFQRAGGTQPLTVTFTLPITK